MKKFVCAVVTMAMLAIPVIGIAKEAKWEKVKIENDYKLYRFQLEDDHFFEYIFDPQACLCFFESFSGASPVDCKKLAVYPEMAKYVEQCK